MTVPAGNDPVPPMAPEPSPAYIPLPAGLESPRDRARATFDRVAATYDAVRPRYPSEVMGRLRSQCDLGPGRRVLEIGCGTGQATRDIASCGCLVRCLEPGPELARIARRNLASCPNVEVVVCSFEDVDEEEGIYDAVVSATAFHWIDPSIAFPKAAHLLRPPGTLALVTNVHVGGGTQDQLSGAIQALHRRLAPEIGTWTFPSVDELRDRATRRGDVAAVWSRVERTFGEPPPVDHLFEPPTVSVLAWVATYDADTYPAMLSTQSTYAFLAPEQRNELLRRIGRLVEDRLGGTVTKQYAAVLATARRAPHHH